MSTNQRRAHEVPPFLSNQPLFRQAGSGSAERNHGRRRTQRFVPGSVMPRAWPRSGAHGPVLRKLFAYSHSPWLQLGSPHTQPKGGAKELSVGSPRGWRLSEDLRNDPLCLRTTPLARYPCNFCRSCGPTARNAPLLWVAECPLQLGGREQPLLRVVQEVLDQEGEGFRRATGTLVLVHEYALGAWATSTAPGSPTVCAQALHEQAPCFGGELQPLQHRVHHLLLLLLGLGLCNGVG